MSFLIVAIFGHLCTIFVQSGGICVQSLDTFVQSAEMFVPSLYNLVQSLDDLWTIFGQSLDNLWTIFVRAPTPHPTLPPHHRQREGELTGAVAKMAGRCAKVVQRWAPQGEQQPSINSHVTFQGVTPWFESSATLLGGAPDYKASTPCSPRLGVLHANTWCTVWGHRAPEWPPVRAF